jgi:membrane fusion protein (multidrug efflux system)
LNEKQYLHLTEREQQQESSKPEPIPLQLKLANNSIYPHNGTFFFANRQVDVNTGTIKVAVLFSNPDNVLRPGMYARIQATTDVKHDALVVPQQAIIKMQTATQLAVVNADKTISIRTITPGETIGSMVIIVEGVKANDQVVVEGLQKIRDGMKVNPEPYEAVKSITNSSVTR